MKFDQKNLEIENNVSKGSPVKDFFKYVIGFLSIVVIGVILLNIISIFLVKYIPASYELKFHNFAFENFYEDKVQSKKEQELQGILDDLVELSELKDHKFRIHIVKNSSENALAHVGGNIFVHDSLLKNVESLNELSFVLAHELGHYKLRHHLSGVMPLIVLGTLSTVLSSDFDMVHKSFISFAELGMLKSSRDKERDADLFATQLVKKRFGHLRGSLGFFKRLSSNSSKLENMTKYISSHPMPEERLKTLENLISKDSTATGEIFPYKYE